MKYGYLFYRKPLPALRRERPCNLGDPIQSIAVILLYEELGIAKEDIIPIDRYDVVDYIGEPAVITMNGIESYEHYAYHTGFLPPPEPLVPVYFSLRIDRDLDQNILDNFRKYGPVGCRDLESVEFLSQKGAGAYLTGCLTMTFPKRTAGKDQKTVFLIDCPADIEPFIPPEIRSAAVRLSQVEWLKSASTGNRITEEETWAFHRSAQARLDLLRDKAKLVVTSRFHAAVPAMAMGIPVILINPVFDPRYEILERILPLYTPDRYHEIDWAPEAADIELEKRRIKESFFSAVRFASARCGLAGIAQAPRNGKKFEWPVSKMLSQIQFPSGGRFRYAAWGVCLEDTQHIVNAFKKTLPSAELTAAIDTYQTGEYMGRPVIRPGQIAQLPEDVIVLVPAPAAHQTALALMEGTGRRFVLMSHDHIECFHFDSRP